MTENTLLHEEDPHQEAYTKNIFGFWVYLMTDCILFGVLFATYAVLYKNTFGGPSSKEIYDLPFVLKETLILLSSSFTCGLGMLAAHSGKKKQVIAWFALTFLLGVSFLVLELGEFSKLIQEGNGWKRSGFLSSYFTLVGTHGLHISVGLFWMVVFMIQTAYKGISLVTLRRLTCLSLFWHFLDVVWIFIFTLVYLLGATL